MDKLPIKATTPKRIKSSSVKHILNNRNYNSKSNPYFNSFNRNTSTKHLTTTTHKYKWKSHCVSPKRNLTPLFQKNDYKYDNSSKQNIELELIDLYRQYTQQKAIRIKTQDNFNSMKNHYNLLKNEITKLQLKIKHEEQVKEKANKMKFSNLQEKEKINIAKANLKEKINELKILNDKRRQERDNYLKNWRENQKEEVKEIVNKIRSERKKEYSNYIIRKELESNTKKEKVKQFNQKRAISAEIKKKEEFNKKLNMKNDILDKIEKEKDKIKDYEDKVNILHRDTLILLEKLKEENHKLINKNHQKIIKEINLSTSINNKGNDLE